MIEHDSSYPSASEWNVACWEMYFQPAAAHLQLFFKLGAHKKLNTGIKWSLRVMGWAEGGLHVKADEQLQKRDFESQRIF